MSEEQTPLPIPLLSLTPSFFLYVLPHAYLQLKQQDYFIQTHFSLSNLYLSLVNVEFLCEQTIDPTSDPNWWVIEAQQAYTQDTWDRLCDSYRSMCDKLHLPSDKSITRLFFLPIELAICYLPENCHVICKKALTSLQKIVPKLLSDWVLSSSTHAYLSLPCKDHQLSDEEMFFLMETLENQYQPTFTIQKSYPQTPDLYLKMIEKSKTRSVTMIDKLRTPGTLTYWPVVYKRHWNLILYDYTQERPVIWYFDPFGVVIKNNTTIKPILMVIQALLDLTNNQCDFKKNQECVQGDGVHCGVWILHIYELFLLHKHKQSTTPFSLQNQPFACISPRIKYLSSSKLLNRLEQHNWQKLSTVDRIRQAQLWNKNYIQMIRSRYDNIIRSTVQTKKVANYK